MKAQNQDRDPYEMLVRREFDKISKSHPLVADAVKLLHNFRGPVEVSKLTEDLISRKSDYFVSRVAVDALNMRRGPNPSEPVLTVLRRGETVRMKVPVPTRDEWVQVEDQSGNTGFVVSRFLEASEGLIHTEFDPDWIVSVIGLLESERVIEIEPSKAGYFIHLTERGRQFASYILDTVSSHG